MASITSLTHDPAKIILIGESGSGKTGALMALICAGYKLRMIDTDNGARTLRGLLDPRYPYRAYIESQGIDLNEAVSIIPIATNMKLRSVSRRLPNGNSASERILAPVDAKAWDRIVSQLEHWRDPETGLDDGYFASWTDKHVLAIDSFTTVSRQAYYYTQELNGHLGAREEGNTHLRDLNGAQSTLRRFLEMIYDPSVLCNVVIVCHIQRIDDSRGYNQSPEQVRMQDPEAVIEVKGFPASVGVALSKRVGIYFNDSFTVRQDGSGRNVKQKIVTTPTTIDGVNIAAKKSAFLDPEYDVKTGLAEIFAALRGQEPPKELVAALGGAVTRPTSTAKAADGAVARPY